MGYSFAAGTTDGPGAFDFTQGTCIFLSKFTNDKVLVAIETLIELLFSIYCEWIYLRGSNSAIFILPFISMGLTL